MAGLEHKMQVLRADHHAHLSLKYIRAQWTLTFLTSTQCWALNLAAQVGFELNLLAQGMNCSAFDRHQGQK